MIKTSLQQHCIFKQNNKVNFYLQTIKSFIVSLAPPFLAYCPQKKRLHHSFHPFHRHWYPSQQEMYNSNQQNIFWVAKANTVFKKLVHFLSSSS